MRFIEMSRNESVHCLWEMVPPLSTSHVNQLKRAASLLQLAIVYNLVRLASFPHHVHLQLLIACSLQKRRGKAPYLLT